MCHTPAKMVTDLKFVIHVSRSKQCDSFCVLQDLLIDPAINFCQLWSNDPHDPHLSNLAKMKFTLIQYGPNQVWIHGGGLCIGASSTAWQNYT